MCCRYLQTHNPVTLLKRGLWPDSLSKDKSQLITARQGKRNNIKNLKEFIPASCASC